MKNIIIFVFIFVKVLSVSGLTDIDQLNNFFNKYITDDYLKTTKNKELVNISTVDGKITSKITSIYIKVGSSDTKNQNFNFSEFPILSELKYLNLTGTDNFNIELYSRIFEKEKYPKLKQLIVEKLYIKKFSNNYPSSSPIEKLILKNCHISEFPSQLEALENLKELNLSQNKIISLPEINFPILEKLIISENQINKLIIPKNIEYIDASENYITYLSKNSKNDKLKELIIARNYENIQIEDIFFNDLDQLKIIDLHDSNINNLPDSIFGLKNVEKLDLSGKQSTKMDIINFKDKSRIKECKFNDNIISCYQESTCSNISSGIYEPCSEETIEEHVNNIYPHSNKPLTVIVILLVIILGIVGCIWMYKIYQKRKQLKDADVIVSPTSNYYDNIINNNVGTNEKSTNRNTQISFPDTLINSNGSVSPVSPESHISVSLNNVQNPNNLTANSTSLNNNMGRSPSVPVGHTTRPIMRSPTAPSGHSTIPMPRSRSVSTRYSVSNSINSYTNSNGSVSMDMTNLMVNNNPVIGNEKNKKLFNNQANSHLAGSSSSSINQKISSLNNNNNEANIQELEEIRLKKKILQEREIIEKHNFYNNYDDQDDPDNNLPPYSEI